jgi:hypothetical protein
VYRINKILSSITGQKEGECSYAHLLSKDKRRLLELLEDRLMEESVRDLEELVIRIIPLIRNYPNNIPDYSWGYSKSDPKRVFSEFDDMSNDFNP